MHRKNYFPILLLLLFSCLLHSGLSAQEINTTNNMVWLENGLSFPVSKKVKIGFWQTYSFPLDEPGLNFAQYNLNVSLKINKRLTLKIGGKPTISVDTFNFGKVYHRLYAEVKHYTKINRRIRMQNKLTAEHHFDQRSKFKQRIFYTLNLYYRNNKWPLRLRPFITQKLYWYQGGRLLQYYNPEGDKTELKSPNGLHAYRLKVGVRIRPLKRFYLTAYFQMQREFNLGAREINSMNPNSEKIRRPFSHFNVFGLAGTYSFRQPKKRK